AICTTQRIPTRSEEHGMIRAFLTRRRRSRSIGTNHLTNRNLCRGLGSAIPNRRYLPLHFHYALFSGEESNAEGFLRFLHTQATVFGPHCLLGEFACEDGLN